MKTAIPPNGVTARCVSRKINRSSDNRGSDLARDWFVRRV